MAIMSRVLILAVAVVAATGCVTIRRHEVQDAEQVRAASGFHMKRANTPEKVADLRSVPPRRLLPQERDGRLYYVYADPEVCRCLYVGTQAQYQEYQRLGLRKRIAEALMAAEQESLNAMTLDWGFWVRHRGPGTDPAWPRPSAGWARTSRIAGGGP
jgi:hypothetical protein